MRQQVVCVTAAAAMLAAGCRRQPPEAAPAAPVVESSTGEYQVAAGAQFPLAAVRVEAQPLTLETTATIAADPARTLQVISPVAGTLVQSEVELGDTVAAGALLGTVRSAELQQAWSDLRTAAADATLAHSQLVRAQDLLQHGAGPQEQVEEARDAAASADARLQAARQKLRFWGLDPATPPAPGDPAGDRLPLRAPQSGVVIALNTAAGTVLPSPDSATPLYTLADLSRIWVLCDLYENDLGMIAVGDTAAVSVAAYPNQTFAGTVANIGGVLDPVTRSAKVRVVLDNPGLRLRPGMYATVELRTRRTRPALLVPETAVVRSSDQTFVFLHVQGSRFRRIAVSAGSVQSEGGSRWMPVSGPLRAGDAVVANALDFITAASLGAGS